MCDYATEEISAIESVFPESFVYLCDFHREQAWERWMTASHHGVTAVKSQILGLLRQIAHSNTEEEAKRNIEILKDNPIWKNHKNLREWFEKYWLAKSERWIRGYRHERFNANINTNNGIERQNMALKYQYLQSKKASSLSHLLQVIVESFNFDSYRTYLMENAKASQLTRSYSQDIPQFLHNRPPNVVKHCFKRWQEAINIPLEDIVALDDPMGQFLVKSQTTTALKEYCVDFNQNSVGLPHCDCSDWTAFHLPCKHFFAVMQNFSMWNWESLPELYRNNPFINLNFETPVSTHAALVENRDETVREEINVEETISEELPQLPLTSAAELKRKRGKISSLCEILKDLSHTSKDGHILDEIINSLEENIKAIKSTIPQTEEFLLDDGPMTGIGTTKRALSVRKLKKRQAKKKGSGRHGAKAEMQRQHYGTIQINNTVSSPSTDLIEEHVVEDNFIPELPVKENLIRRASPSTDLTEEHFVEDNFIPELPVKENLTQRGKRKMVVRNKNAVTFKKRKLADVGSNTELLKKQTKKDNPVRKVQDFVTSAFQNNMSFNVTGYNINRRSFTDLDSMLPDEVMNAYISLKCKEYKDKSVHFLPCEIMTSIFCGIMDDNDPYPIHSFLEGVDIEEFDTIIGALHEGGCHWSLMVIHPKKPELVYLNPLGETRYSKDIYLQKWINFLSDRNTKGIDTFISENWCITSRRHQKQHDSNSCGVFVLRFAELMLKGVEDLRFPSQKKHLQTLRLEIGQFLVESSDNMQETAIMQEVGPSDTNGNIDIDEEDDYHDDNDDTKLSVETCQSHYEACKEKLYDIINCQKSSCDMPDHIRHHEFVANPLRVHNIQRLTHGFGQDIIKMRALEHVHSKLNSDLLHLTGHNHKCPYTVRPHHTIRALKNSNLETRFKAYRLAPQYITYVLLKECIILLHMVTHEEQYGITDEMCKKTEINVSEECRKLRLKKYS